MAQQIRLVDDTDRKTEAVETVTFSVRGRDYEIDLSAENVAKFDEQMEFWVEHARKAGKPPATVHVTPNATAAKKIAQDRPEWSDPVGASSVEKAEYKEMRKDAREWALANGWPQLGDLGRLPVEAYAAWKEYMGWNGDLFACWSTYQRRKRSASSNGRTNGHVVRV